MASNDKPAALDEVTCAVCLEDFKNPKLLPCSHCYCQKCLQDLTDNGRITCPECREKVKVPDRGVQAFPDNRYLTGLLNLRRTFKCLKHGNLLHFFCEDCKEQICTACEVVRHKGHRIVDIEDKAKSCKDDISKTMRDARDIGLELGKHLNQLNKAFDDINTKTSENLDAIDDRREELHKKIREMHEAVQAETEQMKMEVLKRQKENLKKLREIKEETQKAKSAFDEMYIDIEKNINEFSNNEIVQKKDAIKQSFEDCKHTHLIHNFDVKVTSLQFEKKGELPELKPEVVGELTNDICDVPQPEKINQEFRKLTLVTTDVRNFDLGFEYWGNTKMCVCRDGHIIVSGKVGATCFLKCFDDIGTCVWQKEMGKADNIPVCRLCSFPTNSKYFVLTSNMNSIELRNVSDSAVVRKRSVDFPCALVCATEEAVFVVNLGNIPRNVVKFSVNPDSDNCFQLMNITIDTKLNSLYGLDILSHHGNEMLIVTSWQENTIEAVDAVTGEERWKINGEYEGKKLKPHGLCHDDLGNLYVADGRNNRVIVVSPSGQVKQKLLDTPGGVYWVRWLDSRKLVVQYRTNDKYSISIHQIDYTSPEVVYSQE